VLGKRESRAVAANRLFVAAAAARILGRRNFSDLGYRSVPAVEEAAIAQAVIDIAADGAGLKSAIRVHVKCGQSRAADIEELRRLDVFGAQVKFGKILDIFVVGRLRRGALLGIDTQRKGAGEIGSMC
jgi:hypothetical protein